MEARAHRTGMPNVDAFGEQLVEAARRHSRPLRRLRRAVLPLAGVLVLGGGAAVAVGELTSGDDGPVVLQPGDVVTLGFKDPTTGEALRCPDGSLFTWHIDAAKANNPDPTCADGSVPPLYAEYKQREQKYLDQLSAGDSLEDVPHLPTFEVSPGAG